MNYTQKISNKIWLFTRLFVSLQREIRNHKATLV